MEGLGGGGAKRVSRSLHWRNNGDLNLEWYKVVHQHQGWRLVSCIWLHASVIHVLANMLSLIFIGIRLEQQFDFVRVGLIYLLSGLGGSILSSLFIRNSISVSASGALFGLLGEMLSELLTIRTINTNKAAAFLTLIVIVAINLAVGILPQIDNLAHIGGFLTGFLLGFILLVRPQFRFSVGLTMLFKGEIVPLPQLCSDFLVGNVIINNYNGGLCL